MSFPHLEAMGLSPLQLDTFERYRRFLLAWNEKVNLTAITADDEVEIKHFVDSLLLGRYPGWREAAGEGSGSGAGNDAGNDPGSEAGNKAAGRRGKERSDGPGDTGSHSAGRGSLRVADVGAGAGFPGIPLRIVCEDIKLDMFEASDKRVRFLQALATELDLPGVRAFHLRAEDAGRDPRFRERYDWVLSRGVAPAPVLLEYCLPLVKVGGYMAAYKGPAGPEEGESARKAAAMLGGKPAGIVEAALPEAMGERRILLYRKVAATPKAWPRRPGLPSQQPLNGSR